jgi:hypothetical protein
MPIGHYRAPRSAPPMTLPSEGISLEGDMVFATSPVRRMYSSRRFLPFRYRGNSKGPQLVAEHSGLGK